MVVYGAAIVDLVLYGSVQRFDLAVTNKQRQAAGGPHGYYSGEGDRKAEKKKLDVCQLHAQVASSPVDANQLLSLIAATMGLVSYL
jgi:hypothetical protein